MRPRILAALSALLLAGCSPASTPTTAAPTPSQPPATSSSSSSPTVATSPTPTQPDTRAAAVDAFRLWVKQFNAEQWDKHYATMVSAQQKIITAKRYAACKNKQTLPTFKWISTVSTKPNVKTRIPGTSVTKPATVVTARLRVSGYTLPVPAHMFYENGQWRWSMTMENVKGCKA